MEARRKGRRGPAPRRPRATESRRPLAVLLALILLDLAVFGVVRHFQFISLDDPVYVTANANVQTGLSWANAAWAFTTTQAPTWHPLTWLSHMLDVQLFGLDAGAHHATSLVIHVADTLLLFGWLLRATKRLWPAAFAAAVFGVHPLHVESVVWVAERKDVLSALFWMLTLWAYVAYVARPDRGRYLMVALALTLGLMSKPTVVTLPVVLLLLDAWPLGRASFSGPWADWRPLIIEKLPLLVLSLIVCLVTIVVQSHGGAMSNLDTVPLADRVTNALVSYALYMAKLIWPTHLAVFYPLRRWPMAAAGGAAAALAAMTAAAFSLRRTRPYLLVGWSWYLVTLLPMIGVIQVGSQAMADRYMYLPMIGLLIIAAWGMPDLAGTIAPGLGQRMLPALGAAAVLALAVAAHTDVLAWSDNLSLWQHAIDNTPRNYLAYDNLGSALVDRGDLNGALSAFNSALAALDPTWTLDEAMVRTNIGLVLLRQNKTPEALDQFSQAARLNPASAEARDGAGESLARQGRFQEAVAEYAAALRLKPTLIDALLGIGGALLSQNHAEDAIPYYTKAEQLEPQTAQIHNALGSAFAMAGRPDDAKTEFETALRLDATLASAEFNLAVLFAHEGNVDEARRRAMRVLVLDPTYEPAHQLLATLPKGGR